MNPIATMPTGGAALLWGVLTFSLLILLHEGGHFLAARAFGVKVHDFMLGLPGPALTWRSKRSGVRYGVTMIPLGGYVRIAGMEPGQEDLLLAAALGLVADGKVTDVFGLTSALAIDAKRATALLSTLEDYGAAEPVTGSDSTTPLARREAGEGDDALLDRVRTGVYRGQSMWKRIAILSAGVLTNLIAAILILTLTLSIWGVPTPVPTIAAVSSGGPAAIAGIRQGDTITGLDGVKVTEWDQIRSAMGAAAAGKIVTVDVKRGTGTLTLHATLVAKEGGGAMLGVTAATRDVPMALSKAAETSFSMVGQVFSAVGRLANPSTFAVSIQGARSVVGISYEVANAVAEGPLPYAWMIALLSLSLGVMNLLPIPPLDGGKIATELIEGLFRRPIPRRVTLAFSALGTLLLFSLVFYLMYADVLRYVINKG
ncbi:MAG TPA: M50 family metallopeptidase [Coriobacteriia bacterium]